MKLDKLQTLFMFKFFIALLWSVNSMASMVAIDEPISELAKMDRSKLVEKAFEKKWIPANCSKELDFYSLPTSQVPAYLRQGLFISEGWSFPCLSEITKNPQTKTVVQNYLTLEFTKLACSAVPDSTTYFPELIFCREAQWPNGCLVDSNPVQCLQNFNLQLEKSVQWLKKYSPQIYATLSGQSTEVKTSPRAFGPQLPPRMVKPATTNSNSTLTPSVFQTESFQQNLALAEELITSPRVKGENSLKINLATEIKPDEVKISPSKPPIVGAKPAPKTPQPTITIGSNKTPIPQHPATPPRPLTLKDIRIKKYLDPLPNWAKAVHAAAVKALVSPGFIRQPGYCSAWVREVFQSAFPSEALELDYYYFGPSAGGLVRRHVKRGSTLGLWMSKGRVKPYSQVGAKGLRAGDVVFQSYGFDNAGHIGIVVVNTAFPVKNSKGVKTSESLVIAENTQRHCRYPSRRLGCPQDNRGIVSIEKFGDITHVGRFNGWK